VLTVVASNGERVQGVSLLDDIVREGARRMLSAALQAEPGSTDYVRCLKLTDVDRCLFAGWVWLPRTGSAVCSSVIGLVGKEI